MTYIRKNNNIKQDVIINKILLAVNTRDMPLFREYLPKLLDKKNDIDKETIINMFAFIVELGRVEMVKCFADSYILDHTKKLHLLQWSARYGSVDMLRTLISIYNLDKPYDKNKIYKVDNEISRKDENTLIRVLPLISSFHCIDRAKTLMPISYPKGLESFALRVAAGLNKKDIIDLLFDKSDVKVAYERIKEEEPHIDPIKVEYFYEKVKMSNILDDKNKLKNHINSSRVRLSKGKNKKI